MPSSLLFPLEQIKPSEILSQYSEWIYFTLVLVFFVSLSGIALRKHFDKPYVKPLIISVGLMLTFSVFRYRGRLTAIFEGWGILGSILLVVIVGVIPYGLARGFGMSGSRAFYLTYILFYILSWVKFPEIYQILADNNLGIINLGLLVLFFVAIFKVVKFGKLPSLGSPKLEGSNPLRPEISREIEIEGDENRLVKRQAEKMTKIEIRTIGDMAEALAEIQQIIETHRNNLPKEERERIAHILKEISKKEKLFNKSVQNLRKLFQRIDVIDLKELQELKERLAKVDDKQRQIVKTEIREEEEKIRIEKSILDYETRLGQYLNSFNGFLMEAVGHIRGSPYPYDANAPLVRARVVLKDIFEMAKEIKVLEEKLVSLTKSKKKLLKKERETA
jgi:hypothetical protein